MSRQNRRQRRQRRGTEVNPWTPLARPAMASGADGRTLEQLVRAVQVVLWSWTWWIVTTAATTIGGVARAWRRAATSQGRERPSLAEKARGSS